MKTIPSPGPAPPSAEGRTSKLPFASTYPPQVKMPEEFTPGVASPVSPTSIPKNCPALVSVIGPFATLNPIADPAGETATSRVTKAFGYWRTLTPSRLMFASIAPVRGLTNDMLVDRDVNSVTSAKLNGTCPPTKTVGAPEAVVRGGCCSKRSSPTRATESSGSSRKFCAPGIVVTSACVN